MKILRKISLVSMALAIMLGLAATASMPASAASNDIQNCTRWHTVQRGEYLVAIARLYETDWRTIATINKLENPNLIFPQQKLCIFTSGSVYIPPTGVPGNPTSIKVFAYSVKEDQSVSLQGKNLSSATRYSVYLGKYKADLAQDMLVGSVTTDKDGAFMTTFTIPKQLFDITKIRVKLSNSRGETTSNWFINATSSGNTGGIGSPQLSFSIHSINKNKWVKIQTKDLHPNLTYNVSMGKPGWTEKKYIRVGTLRDSKGGTIVVTFEIPDELHDLSKIEIIVENILLETYASLTFDNKDKP